MTLTIDSPRVETATRVELTPEQIASIASVSVAAASPKVPSPIIQTVNVSVIDGMLHAVATDRYRVARVVFPVESADFEGVCIPVPLIVGFAKAVKAAKGNMTLATSKMTITRTPHEIAAIADDVTVALSDSTAGNTVTASAVKGNYPPVARLFPDKFSEGVPVLSLNVKYIADAGKITHPAIRDTTVLRFQFTETSNPAKPGPVLIDFAGIDPAQGSASYLLQPNLIIR